MYPAWRSIHCSGNIHPELHRRCTSRFCMCACHKADREAAIAVLLKRIQADYGQLITQETRPQVIVAVRDFLLDYFGQEPSDTMLRTHVKVIPPVASVSSYGTYLADCGSIQVDLEPWFCNRLGAWAS